MQEMWAFIGIIILFFVLWLAGGGPNKPISFAGPYLNPITQTGTSAQPYGDPTTYQSVTSVIAIGPRSISTSNTVKNTSSLSGTVAFSRDLSGVTSTDPRSEYVAISIPSWGTQDVSTAGWRIVSKSTGQGASFPLGTETPRTGTVNQAAPIVLHPGDSAIVTSGRSPVGVSFKENRCTGYLEEHQDFHPSLALSCPTPSEEVAQFYPTADDTCLAYVRSIPYCSTDTSISAAHASASCEQFIDEHLTYNGCVAGHATDPGFGGTTWRIFLGSENELYAKTHDTVLLLDAEGKVVDSLSY